MGDVHDRVVQPVLAAGLWAFRVRPAGALDQPPPGGSLHGSCRPDALGHELKKDKAGAEALGFGDVAGGGDELGKPAVRDSKRVDGEGAEADLPDGAFAVLAKDRCVGADAGGGGLDADEARGHGLKGRAVGSEGCQWRRGSPRLGA